MTLRNDTDERTVSFSLTPLEALLTLESYAIGAATMIAFDETRGSRGAARVDAMVERLVEATGLERSLALALAEPASGILRLVEAIEKPSTMEVVLRRSEDRRTMEAVVDGREIELITLDPDPRSIDRNGRGWDEIRRLEQEERERRFTTAAPEIVGFLNASCRMGIDYGMEIAFEADIDASHGEDLEEAAQTVIDEILAGMTPAGSISLVERTSWGRTNPTSVRVLATVPFVLREEVGERFALASRSPRVDAGTPRP